jgi:hypothetical protein
MQIRLICQLQTQVETEEVALPVRLWERSGPITACCHLHQHVIFSCEKCLLKHRTDLYRREVLQSWLMFWIAQKPALQVNDHLCLCYTSRAMKFVMLKYSDKVTALQILWETPQVRDVTYTRLVFITRRGKRWHNPTVFNKSKGTPTCIKFEI